VVIWAQVVLDSSFVWTIASGWRAAINLTPGHINLAGANGRVDGKGVVFVKLSRKRRSIFAGLSALALGFVLAIAGGTAAHAAEPYDHTVALFKSTDGWASLKGTIHWTVYGYTSTWDMEDLKADGNGPYMYIKDIQGDEGYVDFEYHCTTGAGNPCNVPGFGHQAQGIAGFYLFICNGITNGVVQNCNSKYEDDPDT
jgi:hypothetical protein